MAKAIKKKNNMQQNTRALSFYSENRTCFTWLATNALSSASNKEIYTFTTHNNNWMH